MMRITKIFVSVFLIISFSCKDQKTVIANRDILLEWHNKEIIIPTSFPIIYPLDSIPSKKHDYQFVHYFNADCSVCYYRLSNWNDFIKNNDLFNQIDPLFIGFGSFPESIIFELRKIGFEHPVYYDSLETLQSIYKFPDDASFRTFLLNQENKIEMIGDPTINSKLVSVYKSIVH